LLNLNGKILLKYKSANLKNKSSNI
jgi:hypothetical protein